MRNLFSILVLVCLLISVLVITPTNAAGGNTDETFTKFTDVTDVHPNVKAIEYLQHEGIVVGYEDGTYGVDKQINRAEFLKIVMEVSDYELGGTNCYTDVTDQWFAQYVCAATDLGLVDGYPDGYFRPERSINFAEASKIVANTLKLEGRDASAGDAEWFKPYVLSLEGEEAIPADIDSFDEEVTRAQMAEMIWRIDADRTYKPFKTYNGIISGDAANTELTSFNSCQELHDYIEDNTSAPYTPYEDSVDFDSIPSGAIAVAPSMAEKGGCFTGKTQITMADGSHKSIEDIKEGDVIMTKADPASDELVRADVETTVSHLVDGYLVINDNLEVTPEHIVYVNGEWDVAGSVEMGDYLMNADGEEVEVYSVEKVDRPTWVYNFEVEDYHTYLANNLYVHNDKGEATDYSSTNLQEQGVDEADIVKNDGKYIYSLKGDTVRIVEAYPPEGMEELDMVTFESEKFYPYEMYVDGDTMVVIGNSYASGYFDEFETTSIDPVFYYHGGSTKVYIYDITDRSNVELIRDFSVEGDYKDSRKVGDTVYLVANQWNNIWPWLDDNWKEEDLVPLTIDNGELDTLAGCTDVLYMPEVVDTANYIIVTAIPLDPDKEVGNEVILGSSTELYSSTENMYIAQEKYSWWGWYGQMDEDEVTYIHKLSLDENNVEYQGMGEVPGSILNQFSMDEHEGNFRIVTTIGDVWNEENPSESNLYILGEDLNILGKVEGLAPGERVYSARFVGDRAYIVTFKKVDPLFVIDIIDPSNPEIKGQLKIPGFSDYLHPFDEDHIIGFGMDTANATEEELEERGIDFAWYQGIKMALFDITNVQSPVELHREIIGDRGTHSELNYNHKALLFSHSKGATDDAALMAFPISVSEISEEDKASADSANVYGETVFQGAYIYDVSVDDGFDLRGTITHFEEADIENSYSFYGSNAIERVLYIGDYLYTVSRATVQANDLDAPMDYVNSVDYYEEEAEFMSQ